MKKLLTLIIVLWCSAAWAVEPINLARTNPYVAGAGVAAAGTTAYCTGAATCTATNPGECDQICEDFEGSSDCGGTGDDTYCRNGYGVTIGSGDAVTFNETANGTYGCASTTNSRVAQVSVSAASRATNFRKQIGTDTDDLYVQFYLNIVSESIADNGNFGLFTIYNDSSSNLVAMLYIKQVAGVGLKMKVGYYNSSNSTTYSADGATSLSTGTWYRVTMYAKTSTGTLRFYIDGTPQIEESTTFTTTRKMNYVLFGQTTDGSTGTGAFVVQYDNIAIDNDTLAGACLN